MYIPKLDYPGYRVAGLSPDVARHVEAVFRALEGALANAALALDYFDTVRVDQRLLEKERSDDLCAFTSSLVEAATVPRAWQDRPKERPLRSPSGAELPQEYELRVEFLHARSFVTSMALVGRCLGELVKLVPSNAALGEAEAEFRRRLPDVHEVRNTVEHHEERVQWKNNHKRSNYEVLPKPVDLPGFCSVNGCLVTDFLRGTMYGCTMADGTFGEVDVSAISLESAVGSVQLAILALDWEGEARTTPRFA